MGQGKTCQRKSRTSLNFQVYVGFSYIASISFTCLSAFKEFKNQKKIKLVAPKPVTQT